MIKNSTDRDYYKSLRNLVNSTMEREKTAYFQHYVVNNQNNSQKMWKHIKQTSLFHSTRDFDIPPELNDPDKINEHFLNIPGNPSVDPNLIAHFKDKRYNELEFKFKNVTESEIHKILYNINTNAAGHDNITIKMILLTLPDTLPIITHIANESINQQIFPSSWKTALVRPIPKSNNVAQHKDLRPISLLPILSKLIEKIIKDQMITYINDANILPAMQSGFRSGYGTETALLTVADDLITASDSGSCSALVLLDFSRAFDCINIELMIAKLKYYGFSEGACKWFESYLSDRKQIVALDNEKGNRVVSKPGSLTRGTPQGAILSPILFVLYTADLPQNLKHCMCHLYADDTQVYFPFKATDTTQAMEKINSDLKSISNWAEANSLVLNPLKSKFLIVGTKQQRAKVLEHRPKLMINNLEIPRTDKARNLGLIMDEDLRFESHINEKVRSAFYKLKVLYGLRKYLTKHVREILVDSLVLSPFIYCSAVYGPRLWVKTEKQIQKVQNACARFCYTIPKRAHVTPFLNKHNKLNMKHRRELHLACLIHKVVWSKCPPYLHSRFKWSKDGSSCYNTRRKLTNLLEIPAHKTKGFRGSFSYMSAKIWNNIPPPLRVKITTRTFKIKYRKLLLAKQISM